MSRYERHNEQAREKIKDAFLAVLEERSYEDISMADVARRANMSRSTLYSHFSNLQLIYEACARDYLSGSRSLVDQLRVSECSECAADRNDRPFCEMIRHAGKYQVLVDDPFFFRAAMDVFAEEGGGGLIAAYQSMGIDAHRAEVLGLFQMTGCFMVASTRKCDEDWSVVRDTIDTFIRGGVAAVRAKGDAGA